MGRSSVGLGSIPASVLSGFTRAMSTWIDWHVTALCQWSFHFDGSGRWAMQFRTFFAVDVSNAWPREFEHIIFCVRCMIAVKSAIVRSLSRSLSFVTDLTCGDHRPNQSGESTATYVRRATRMPPRSPPTVQDRLDQYEYETERPLGRMAEKVWSRVTDSRPD
jgi:hypothetical protein